MGESVWPTVPLGELAEVSGGVTLGRSIAGPGTMEVPYLRVANVQDGYLDLSDVKTVRIFASERSRYLLQAGDVVMNEGGDFDKLGRGTVWEGQIPECAHQNHVFRVRCNCQRLHPWFLAAILASDYGRRYFVRASKQTTNLATVNSTQIKGFPISLPDLVEQNAIVKILRSLDEAIHKTEQILDKLEQVKQGLLHDLLTRGIDDNGELRDPERHPEQFKDSPLGRIPTGWCVHRLEDVGVWTSGGTPSKAQAGYWGGEIPWVSPKDMKAFRLSQTQATITMRGVGAGSRVVPAGSVFIVVRGMILAHTFPVCVSTSAMAFNQDVKGIVPREGIHPEYLAFWFVANSHHMLGLVTEATHGTKRLALADLHRQLIAIPSPEEQDTILSVIRTDESKFRIEEQKLSKLQLLKKALMEDLLTGKTRVTPLLEEKPNP